MKHLRQIIIAIILFTTIGTSLFAQSSLNQIAEYLDSKKFVGDKTDYTEASIEVPFKVENALSWLGVSRYTLLRNEFYARKGYVFKNEKLNLIFNSTSWYEINPAFDFSLISKQELKNINYIKSIEDSYDVDIIVEWLNNKGYFADVDMYNRPEFFKIENKVLMALNHLKINPSRILRNEIFARNGYIFRSIDLNEIFKKTAWYRPESDNAAEIIRQMEKKELFNVSLLREREWLDILNSVYFTLPENIKAIPVIGQNALFVKELENDKGRIHYSSNSIAILSSINNDIISSHKTYVNNLVSESVIEKINKEADPLKKLVLFFENKKYHGYADSKIFNLSDMTVPIYLEQAVKTYGVDYKILLRKEIHARNGAYFIDKKSEDIFNKCSWYQAEHYLNTKTISSFPSHVKISDYEIRNFAIIEGEHLHELRMKYKPQKFVFDLAGNIFFVKTGSVQLSDYGEPIEIGYGFKSIEEFRETTLDEVIKNLLKKFDFDPEEFERNEEYYNAAAC